MAGIADSARFFLATDAQRLAKSFAIDASNGSLPTTGTGFTRILFNFSARRFLKGRSVKFWIAHRAKPPFF
jgi:hypothetical protein